jgi:hypothetical protein
MVKNDKSSPPRGAPFVTKHKQPRPIRRPTFAKQPRTSRAKPGPGSRHNLSLRLISMPETDQPVRAEPAAQAVRSATPLLLFSYQRARSDVRTSGERRGGTAALALFTFVVDVMRSDIEQEYDRTSLATRTVPRYSPFPTLYAESICLNRSHITQPRN